MKWLLFFVGVWAKNSTRGLKTRHRHTRDGVVIEEKPRRGPMSSEEAIWQDEVQAFAGQAEMLDLSGWFKLNNKTRKPKRVSLDGCCPLAYEMRTNPEWRAFRFSFGAQRYPCCVGDLEWYQNAEGRWRMRPREPPKSLLHPLDEDTPDLDSAFDGLTVVVAGDSVARQLVMAMLCAISERPTLEQPDEGWAKGADLLAEYENFRIVRAGDRGRTSLVDTARLVQAAPTPVELVLVGGGTNGLGHHWLSGKCSNVTLANHLTPDAAREHGAKCVHDYARAAKDTVAAAVRAVGGNPAFVHLITTTPQHNPTLTGEYHADQVETDVLDKGCAPLPLDARSSDHWRNLALQDAARRHKVTVYDAFDIFRHFWDAHLMRSVKYNNPDGPLADDSGDIPSNPRSSRDCLHFCQHKRVWHGLLQRIAHAVVLNKVLANATDSDLDSWSKHAGGHVREHYQRPASPRITSWGLHNDTPLVPPTFPKFPLGPPPPLINSRHTWRPHDDDGFPPRLDTRTNYSDKER